MFHSWMLLMLDGPGEFLVQYQSTTKLWHASLSLMQSFKAPKHLWIRLEEYNFGSDNLTNTPLLYSKSADLFKTACNDFSLGFGLTTGEGSEELTKPGWPCPDTGESITIDESLKNLGSTADGGRLEVTTLLWLLLSKMENFVKSFFKELI